MPPSMSAAIPARNGDESNEGTFVISSDPIVAGDLVNFSLPNTPVPWTAASSSMLRTPPELEPQGARNSESEPLLGLTQEAQKRRKKPFYRARPMWIVPFALVASITRGMTMAPRIEVYTQLSCSAIRHRPVIYNNTDVLGLTSLLPYERLDSVTLLHALEDSTFSTVSEDIKDDNPLRIPTKRCLSDPAVQAGAARLQTIMTTMAGALSVLTTGWWGHFSERHGRTRVLAASTLGLLLTDLLFVLVSLPGSPLAVHGHKLLIVAPVVEGLLGGWSTLQSATSAYISDCTSDGSRAQIFSRFLGVFYIGFSLGPMIGAYIIAHPPPLGFLLPASERGGHTVAPVFWAACIGAFINFLLALFLFPESLGKEKRKERIASEATATTEPSAMEQPAQGPFALIKDLFKPLAIFAPTRKGSSMDYNMTFLALALFGYLLSSGIYQVRYLYAEHMYGWEAKELSYYITFVGSARAIHLLVLLPFVISVFKPKLKMTSVQKQQMAATGKKPKPTKAQLAVEMEYDLLVSRISFIIDILSHTLVSFSSTVPTSASQAAFVGSTTLSSFASGVMPSMQSLALCIMQADAAERNKQLSSNDEGSKPSAIPTGSLFGALSVLQSGAQMILAPVLFGLAYSVSVAQFPKAIFVLGALILVCGLVLHSLIHPRLVAAAERKKRRKDNYLEWSPPELERGRSRVSKDLSQGFVTRTANYGSNNTNRNNVLLRTEQFVCH